MKRPRGVCKVCGKEFAVRRDGTLQGHGFNAFWPEWCAGSWEKGWKPNSIPIDELARMYYRETT